MIKKVSKSHSKPNTIGKVSTKKAIKFQKMKAKQRKSLEESDCSSSEDSSSGSEIEDTSSSESEVEIKFELFNMAESDYHSIKQYLNNSFGAGEHGVDLVGLTSFIVEDLADHLGTCVKTDGESSDPFGFLSGFPISFAHKASLKTMESFLTKKCCSEELERFFLNEKNVILFHERLINVPGSIAAPLYRQFLDDWSLAASDTPSHFGQPKDVLLITPTYREIISKLDRELGLQGDTKKFGVASTETLFYYEEMEFISDFASNFFDFSVNTGHETSDSRRAFSDNGIEPGRRAYLLTWEKLNQFVEHLESL